MSDTYIGRREYGQKGIRMERTYHCAIMDEVVYESETTIEDDHFSPFFGQRVCLKHKDDPSYDSNFASNPPLPSSTEDEP